MLIITVLSLLGGATLALARALAQGPVESVCLTSPVTVTTTQTVTAPATVIVISIFGSNPEASSIISALTQVPSSVAYGTAPTTTDSVTTTFFDTSSTTLTYTLESVASSGYDSFVLNTYGSSSSQPIIVSATALPSSTTTSTSPFTSLTISSTSTCEVDTDTAVTTKYVTSTVPYKPSSTSATPSAASSTSVNGTEESTTIVTLTRSRTSTTRVTARRYTNTTANAFSTSTTTSSVTDKPVYAFSVHASGPRSHYKRSVCELLTATEPDGTVITFANAWDGTSYVPTCSVLTEPTSTSTVTVLPVSTTSPLSPYAVPTSSTTSSTSSTAVTSSSSSSKLPSSVSLNSTTTSTAPPTASSCGEVGTFVITFDDLPMNSAFNNNTAPFPPIFAPYRHFMWSEGWTYVPPPTDPFVAQNGRRLGIYIPPSTDPSVPALEDPLIYGGWFGGGAVAPVGSNAFWFDANAAFVGCDNGPWNNATQDCIVTARGYHYNQQAVEIEVTSYTWSIPPCKTTTACQLSPIIFDDAFVSLSRLSFQATVGDDNKYLFIDTFEASWTNDTCEAGRLRASTSSLNG